MIELTARQMVIGQIFANPWSINPRLAEFFRPLKQTMLSAGLIVRVRSWVGHAINRLPSHLASAEFLAFAHGATVRLRGEPRCTSLLIASARDGFLPGSLAIKRFGKIGALDPPRFGWPDVTTSCVRLTTNVYSLHRSQVYSLDCVK